MVQIKEGKHGRDPKLHLGSADLSFLFKFFDPSSSCHRRVSHVLLQCSRCAKPNGLNGKPSPLAWIRHSEIAGVGVLGFIIGPEPNKKRVTQGLDLPPSVSTSVLSLRATPNT